MAKFFFFYKEKKKKKKKKLKKRIHIQKEKKYNPLFHSNNFKIIPLLKFFFISNYFFDSKKKNVSS